MLYANKVNPTLWQNVNDVEQFGFLSKSPEYWHSAGSGSY